VTNDKIFDNPVYNCTTDFRYICVPVPYGADRSRAEQILLASARAHTQNLKELGNEASQELERRYMMQRDDTEPRVYYRLTDNWCEMAMRFIVDARHVRHIKDRLSPDILSGFDAAGIQVASATFEITGLPEARVRVINQ
jgi:small-conductance mechanosensitive channel